MHWEGMCDGSARESYLSTYTSHWTRSKEKLFRHSQTAYSRQLDFMGINYLKSLNFSGLSNSFHILRPDSSLNLPGTAYHFKFISANHFSLWMGMKIKLNMIKVWAHKLWSFNWHISSSHHQRTQRHHTYVFDGWKMKCQLTRDA